MHTMYNFVVGPLAWAAFAIFIIGMAYKLISRYALARKKDGPYLTYMSWKYSLRSIIVWLIPFVAQGWKQNPVTTAVTFIFHICLVALPIWVMGHVALWGLYWDVTYWTIPAAAADWMTVIVIAACVFFGVRRIMQPEVKFVTQPGDWVALIIAALPFITGFLAYHQIFDYKFMIILHILTGELFLAAIPFTRLSHMFFSPFTRAYIGSEFGGVRKVKDW